MPEPSAYTVVREILTENIKLTADEVITRARAKGVTKPNADVRKVVHSTRTELKRKRRKGRSKPSALSAYTAAREVLLADPHLSTDDVLERIKARGITKPDSEVREAIRATRGKLRRAGTLPVPAAARVTVEPKPASGTPDESALFAGVRLANKTAHLCGGVAKAREIAEAIRGCGGIDDFLKRLELVAEILGSDTEM